MIDFAKSYFFDFKNTLNDFLNEAQNMDALIESVRILKNTKNRKNIIFLIGNGGSSAIADHMAIDLTKNAGLRALSICGAPMLTTFANDFGFENVFQKAIEYYATEGDVLIAISGTGSSLNILNACEVARIKKMKIITFSGFEKDNLLSQLGDINFWINSKAFGYLEIIHNLLIHYINDAIIGRAEYMIR